MRPLEATSPALASRLAAGLLASPLWLLAPMAAAASITGVCPDGSIFIVQDRGRIPCAAAKEVAPENVPPMRPEYLPRPYTWQVYREGADPNNPYNLIDSARRVREMRGQTPAPGGAGEPGVGTTTLDPRPFGAAGPEPAVPGVSAPPAFHAARATPPPAPLRLAPEEVRDLFLIVELSQPTAPGRFVKEDARGETTLEVSFAHSPAFERRVREARPEAVGPVVLFTVLAHAADAFHPNFTFVQGHESFRPDPGEAAQLGILEGEAGALAAEQVVLGYVVLPDRMDLGESLDLYWNDRRIETVLRP